MNEMASTTKSRTQPTPAAVVVRPAAEPDVPQLVHFNLRLAEQTESRQLDRATLTRGVLNALRAPDRARYYIAEVETTPVGQAMVTYEWSDWRDGLFWWLQSVYVEIDWRQRGVFRSLFSAISEEAARTPNVCGLRLYVDQNNHQAMQVYRALGMNPSSYRLYELEWTSGQPR